MGDYKVKKVKAQHFFTDKETVTETIEKYTGEGWNYELHETIQAGGDTVGLVFRKDD